MSIMARIRAHGGEVIRDKWRISLRKGRLTAEALTWIAKHRDALMHEVWPEYDAWIERAAIMEFEAGMPREAAERAAYEGVMKC